MSTTEESNTEELRRHYRGLHEKWCAVRQPEYAGGPCQCGLVDASIYDPVKWQVGRAAPIKPALSAEQWKESERGSKYSNGSLWVELEDRDYGRALFIGSEYGDEMPQLAFPEDRHAIAALALYGQPFGFTQYDANELIVASHNLAVVGQREAAAHLSDLAKRVQALLPPDEVKDG